MMILGMLSIQTMKDHYDTCTSFCVLILHIIIMFSFFFPCMHMHRLQKLSRAGVTTAVWISGVLALSCLNVYVASDLFYMDVLLITLLGEF